MTRYYNENPQVRHWVGKCAMLQQELDAANETIAQLKDDNKFWENLSNQTKARIIEAFLKFNSLPWYKKMFFKFKI